MEKWYFIWTIHLHKKQRQVNEIIRFPAEKLEGCIALKQIPLYHKIEQ